MTGQIILAFIIGNLTMLSVMLLLAAVKAAGDADDAMGR